MKILMAVLGLVIMQGAFVSVQGQDCKCKCINWKEGRCVVWECQGRDCRHD